MTFLDQSEAIIEVNKRPVLIIYLHDLTAAAPVAVSMSPVVTVAVTSVMRVTMPRPPVLEHEDTNEVDEEAED